MPDFDVPDSDVFDTEEMLTPDEPAVVGETPAPAARKSSAPRKMAKSRAKKTAKKPTPMTPKATPKPAAKAAKATARAVKAAAKRPAPGKTSGVDAGSAATKPVKVGTDTIVLPAALASSLTAKDLKKLRSVFKRAVKRGKKRAAAQGIGK